MDSKTKEFINKHLNDDIHTLSLRYKNDRTIDLELALRQIVGKNKAKYKIPSFYLNDEILYPAQLSLEQSSSESTAKYKSTLCEGVKLVDLTGGFGIDCYYISKNFKEAVYVERQIVLCEYASNNFKVLGGLNIEIVNDTSESYLEKITAVDLIYIDPARRNSNGKKVVSLNECEPDISILAPALMQKAKKVMVKLSPMFDINLALNELPNTNEVHIISVENECKELVLILSETKSDKIPLKMINLTKNNSFQFFESEIRNELFTECEYASEILLYLYEPNSSIMKAGAFKFIAKAFNLKKLHVNTHLYTSNELIVDFPGRVFSVISVTDSSKIELKKLFTTTPKANINVRNYPLTVEEFRKKTKITDGGTDYIFACKLNNDKNSIIKCVKTI